MKPCHHNWRVCTQHAVDFIRLHHFLGCQSQQLQCYVPSSHTVISLAQGRQWSMMFMLLSPLLLLLHRIHQWYKLFNHYENNNVLWSMLLIMLELFSNSIFNEYLISIITKNLHRAAYKSQTKTNNCNPESLVLCLWSQFIHIWKPLLIQKGKSFGVMLITSFLSLSALRINYCV